MNAIVEAAQRAASLATLSACRQQVDTQTHRLGLVSKLLTQPNLSAADVRSAREQLAAVTADLNVVYDALEPLG